MARWREDPATVRPMLASLEEPPVVSRGLVYEPKYDGIRAIVDVRPPSKRGAAPVVAIYSRNGNDKRTQFPAIASACEALARTLDAPLLLDGEIVATGPDGEPLGFQDLQGRIHLSSPSDIERAEREQPTALIAFDLLRDGDEDLRPEPFAVRRLRLQQRVKVSRAKGAILRLSAIATDDGRPMLQQARRLRWEGLIVKNGQSIYQSGKRTPAWRKMKLLKQQEFVIGGWTEPRQSRQHLGALLVGYYDDGGALRWAGSVGTGFDHGELERLGGLLEARHRSTSPFADAFKTMEVAHWVAPELVAEVRFAEWTSDGLLRQPVYLGTRDDKRAKDVRREDAFVREKPALPMNGRYRRNRRAAPDPVVVPKAVASTPRAAAPASSRTAAVKPVKRKAPTGASGLAITADAAAAIVAELSRLEDARRDGEVGLPNGQSVRVTNLAKPLWPSLGVTKGDLLRYYVSASSLILPAVADRPLVMKRFPNGVDKPAFYQQRHPEAPPAGVRRQTLPPDIDPPDADGPRDRLIGGDLTTLLYMAQLAAISQDPWFSRVTDPESEDYAAIDLDPGDGTGFDKVIDVARWVKDELDRLGIPAVPKTSGASGMHIYIPLPPHTSYDTGQLLCQMVATTVSDAHPKIATIERMVRRRPRGTVYVDYLQNILGKTLATAYSVRASDYAGVSTPLSWKEVTPGLDPHAFTIRTALARFRSVGDLWAALRTMPPVDLHAIAGGQRASRAAKPTAAQPRRAARSSSKR